MNLRKLTVYCQLLDAHRDAARKGQPLLTEAGIAYIRRVSIALDGANATQRDRLLPSWDGRRLWFGGRLLKDFSRQPAPYQTRLLQAFEKQGWSLNHLENALAIVGGESQAVRRRRLHDTIKYLNRNLPRGSIRFHGDGTGNGVCWINEHDDVDRDPATLIGAVGEPNVSSSLSKTI